MEIDVCVCVPYSLSRPNRRQGFVEDQKASTHIPRRITTSLDDRFDSCAIKEEAAEEYKPSIHPPKKKGTPKSNVEQDSYNSFRVISTRGMMKYELNFFESFSRQVRSDVENEHWRGMGGQDHGVGGNFINERN
jgi:hypothetical protein